MKDKFQLPDQYTKESKKGKKWHIQHGNMMIGYLGELGSDDNLEISSLWDVYNCVNTKDDGSAKDGYGFSLTQDYIVYPLAETIIDQIISDYLSRPLKRKTYTMNTEAINSKLDHIAEVVTEDMMRQVNPELEQEMGFVPETANPDMDMPEDVEEYKMKYKTSAEEISDDMITFFLEVLRQKEKIKMLLINFLVTERSAVFIGKKGKHLDLSTPRYDECYYDVNHDGEVQKDINIWAEYKYFTESEVYNEFKLSNKDRGIVKKMFAELRKGNTLEQEFSYSHGSSTYTNCKTGTSYKDWYDRNKTTYRLKVLKMYWKGNKTIKLKQFENKHNGKTESKLLPTDYKVKNRDKIKNINLESVHFVHMVGPELCLDYGEIQPRNSSIDEPQQVQIPASAIIGRNYIPGAGIRSVAKKLEKLQEFASDILYELNMELKSNKARVLVYDVAQTPKAFIDAYGKNALNRVMHHIKKDRMLFINSKDKNARNTFNQFTSLDLDNSKGIQTLMNGLMLMEDLARKFTGITKEKQEGGEKYQTATGINRAIISSNMRVEIYFEAFDNFITDILNKYLRQVRLHYKEGDTFNLIFGDEQNKFLTLHKDHLDKDIGLYIGDSSKETARKQMIDQGAQMALGSAQTVDVIRDLLDVLLGESAGESKAILDKTIQKMEDAQNQRAQGEQEQAQQAQQADMQDKEAQRELSREGYEKDIQVAHIYADNKTNTENERIASAEAIKSAELEDKERDRNSKERSENKKNDKPDNKEKK